MTNPAYGSFPEDSAPKVFGLDPARAQSRLTDVRPQHYFWKR